MSVIVALKYKNGVLIGADKQCSSFNIKEDNNAIKINKTKYSNNCMGVVGSLRDANIILNKNKLIKEIKILDKKEIDFKYVVNIIVPNLFEILRKNNRVSSLNNIETLSSTFVYCTNKNLYMIFGDGAVVEREDFITVGCGSDEVRGYLNTLNLENLTKEKATEIIQNSIQKSCKDDIYINDKIDLIYLESEESK